MPPKKNEPWPETLAAKVLASYIHLKYDLSAALLRAMNPPMGALPFYNNSASPEIRAAELAMVAASFQKFLLEIGVPLHKGKTQLKAHDGLVASMIDENAPSSGMALVVDDFYRFLDEPKDA